MYIKRLFLLLSFLFFSQFNYGQTSNYKKSIDDFLNYLVQENSFLGNVEMKRGNEVIYSYKSNPLEYKNGQYKIGSITKIFTAIVILQLIEEQKLTLETPLNKFYPKIKNAEGITIENLLSHTSGIYNFTFWEDYYSNRKQNFSKEQTLNIIYSGKPEFKPTKDCSYSNSNYTLLGYIIEDLTGKSYATNVRERITDKIDLNHTFVAQNEHDIKNFNSYFFNGKNWLEDISSHPSLPFSAGAIISTTSDLNKFMDNIFHGNLVSNQSLSTMQNLKSKSIGHGLFKLPFYDKIGWGHTGSIDEFKSVTSYFPTEDLYLSITTNGSRISLNDVMIGILSKYYDKKYDYPKFYHTEIKNPPISNFTGIYKAKLGGLITVGKFEITPAEDNYLFMTELQNDKIGEKGLLERIDASTFYLRSAKGKLIFTLDKNNNVEKLVLEQGKMSIKCTKMN